MLRIRWQPALGLAALAFIATPALAHVKWFAPYIVGTPPQPIGITLTNVWFWAGIALVAGLLPRDTGG